MDEKSKEFVAAKHWDTKQTVSFIAAFVVYVVVCSLILTFVGFIAGVFIALGGGAIYLMFNTFKAEYAYTISQRLTVEILKSGNKRKPIAEFFISDMLACAPYNRAEYKSLNEGAAETQNASTDKEDEKTYFALFERDGKKTVLLFTPTEMMLNELDRHTSHKSIR